MKTTGHQPIGLLLKSDRDKCPVCLSSNYATVWFYFYDIDAPF